MLQVIVRGGTNAGTKTLATTEIPRNEWACPSCSKSNPYYWRKCPNCGTERPY